MASNITIITRDEIINNEDLYNSEIILENKSNINRVIKIEIGTKIEVRDFVLKQLMDEPFVKEKFKLNIKRINRWWYSVYFDEICNHDCETLVFGEDKYCSKCKEKV